jgi:DegV family protein with EDD domain
MRIAVVTDSTADLPSTTCCLGPLFVRTVRNLVVAQRARVRRRCDVEVIDSRLVGGALGLAVLRALRVARDTGDPAQARAAVERVRDGVVGLLIVDTLVFLRRGGRLSGAQAAVGTALNVKPLLGVVDGRVEVVDRARTSRRAFDRAVELAAQRAGGSVVDACVVHASAPGRASALEARLSQHVAIATQWRASIGPIVGTHVGPGAVGLAVVPAE